MAGGILMERPGYFRKYIILEQLDPGFAMQRSPDGFARLEGDRTGIALSIQVRFLKEGAQPYTVILIYEKDADIGVFRIGTLQIISRIGSFRRFLDHDTVESLDLRAEKIRYILIASEHKEKVFIPLAGCCKKTVKWDESVRRRLFGEKAAGGDEPVRRKPLSAEKAAESNESVLQMLLSKDKTGTVEERKERYEKQETAGKEERKKDEDISVSNPGRRDDKDISESIKNKIDDLKLEKKLKESFEPMDPFSNPRHDYSWYRVNDIAKLSNILFSCNLTIPLFANPKILVGLFKYRHLLSGFYRSDINNMNYFVLGVPAKDETDGKPFENICRWVQVKNSEFGDMTGYWLVYINLKDGEFVC